MHVLTIMGSFEEVLGVLVIVIVCSESCLREKYAIVLGVLFMFIVVAVDVCICVCVCCLQMAVESFTSRPSSHTVSHSPPRQTSTRPLL